MNKERELLGRAKNNLHGAKLCSINSMSSRAEMLRLMDETIKGIDEFLASEPESDEPVYQLRIDMGQLRVWMDVSAEFYALEQCEKRTLYTRPKPERKSMTMEDLETLARRCDYENDKMAHWHKTNFEDGFIAGWKQAEKHHGIGGES